MGRLGSLDQRSLWCCVHSADLTALIPAWQERCYLSHYHSQSWAQMSFLLCSRDTWKDTGLVNTTQCHSISQQKSRVEGILTGASFSWSCNVAVCGWQMRGDTGLKEASNTNDWTSNSVTVLLCGYGTCQAKSFYLQTNLVKLCFFKAGMFLEVEMKPEINVILDS